jgi:hypothetical protein
MPILRIHLFRVYKPQHESDIIRLEAVETERRSRLVYCRKNIFQTATKYSFSFTSSDKFWTKLIIISQTCFRIMTQKMTGLAELNLQWELYIFTLLFSSTGLLWLLVLWIWFNYFLFIPLLVLGGLLIAECLYR